MDVDTALLRGLTERRMSRRSVVRVAGIGAGAVSLQAFLAACSVKGTNKAAPTSSANPSTAASAAGGSASASGSAPASGTSADSSSAAGSVAASSPPAQSEFWAKQQLAHVLNFASWPLYIDASEGGGKVSHPSLDLFTKKTGIKVNYREVIQDSGSFFGKEQPVFAAGKDIGYDLMIITNGAYLTKMIDLSYLLELDQTKLANFTANASRSVQNPSYDRGNKFTVPWQSGITGIAYDPARTKREITSFADLFDPAFKGKVGMFGDNQDLPNLALAGIGVNPEESTPEDWKKAAAKLIEQRKSGQVRKYYLQDYIDPLLKGDIWLSMAWSGDVYQANASGGQLKFVVPKEGGVLWTDNLCIPAKAAHPLDAMTYIDYIYQPDVAAMMAESVNYITPVPAAREVIMADAAAAKKPADKTALESLANSELVFPSASELIRLSRYRVLTPAEEKLWNATFEPVYQS